MNGEFYDVYACEKVDAHMNFLQSITWCKMAETDIYCISALQINRLLSLLCFTLLLMFSWYGIWFVINKGTKSFAVTLH